MPNRRKTFSENGYVIREFIPEDADGVIECIRDAYGESYVKPFLYNRDELLRLDSERVMCFSVAVADNGDIAGITAFERDEHFSEMGEIACQVIRRDYSGQGLAIELAMHAMQRAEREDFTAQYARALGCHLISQKTLKRMGFTACGFMLNVFDKRLFLHRFQNGDYAKIPQSVAVKKQKKASVGRLWLPHELLKTGRSVYSELGVDADICIEAIPPLTGDSLLESYGDTLHNTLSVWVRGCGADIEGRLDELLAQVGERSGQSIQLYINIGKDGGAKAYSCARARGFFFTGFLPCCADGDYMIMHHPLKLPVKLNEIPHIPEYDPFIEEIRRQLCRTM